MGGGREPRAAFSRRPPIAEGELSLPSTVSRSAASRNCPACCGQFPPARIDGERYATVAKLPRLPVFSKSRFHSEAEMAGNWGGARVGAGRPAGSGDPWKKALREEHEIAREARRQLITKYSG